MSLSQEHYSYLPGTLVKNERDDELGVIICQDEPHKLYWRVLTAGGMKTWSQHNLQRVENERAQAATENAWLEETTDSIVIMVDRISIAFLIEEFLDFCDEMDEIRSKLMADPRFVMARIKSGDKNVDYLTRKITVDDEDYN